MKKNIIITVLVVVNIIALINLSSSNDDLHNIGNEQQKLLLSKYWIEKNLDGLLLNNRCIVDVNNTPIDIKDVIGNALKVIVVHSENDCNKCIEAEITNLKELANNIGSENIIFLSSYSSPRNMELFKSLNNLNMDVYGSKFENFGFPEEENLTTPFIFLTDSTLRVNMAFVPIKEAPKFSQKYYSVIKERFPSSSASVHR